MASQPCPDPSVHQYQHKLSEQASTAALYATHLERGMNQREVLSPDGKLSSKGAAASLKYARPQDLPSFPTHGIDTANSAGQAAMLAKDYKMKDIWQPELSSAGSRAALLAHKDCGKLDLWQPSASADGNSAAKLAMQNKTLSPQLDYGYTKDGRSNALLAATMSQRDGRQRAASSPVVEPPLYPDSVNSAHNALNAATISHRASVKQTHTGREPDGWGSAAMQAARVQNIGDHMDREMFTEHPPVEIEQQEKRDKDALRASAISMAKQMYEVQHRTTLGDSSSFNGKLRATSTASPDIKQEAMRYIHLQDAAHKLAQERLAKVDKNFETMRYREYYGYNASPQKSRLSMSGFMRKRATSETSKDDVNSSDDEEQARRVRNQMSQFNTALASVDAKKQQTDRDALMAIAQKRVQKSMSDMDAKVFQDTGKIPQSMMDEWEAKAKKRATEDAEKREINKGKTHIGAGKYMDTGEIEAIAHARLKPTFDEINETAERRRAQDEAIRLKRAEQERLEELEKQRNKQSKDEWKRFKEEEKATAKREKEERKAAEGGEPEQHRSFLARLSTKRKSREIGRHEAESIAGGASVGATLGQVAEKAKEDRGEPTAVTDAPPPATTAAKPYIPTNSAKEESGLPLAALETLDDMNAREATTATAQEIVETFITTAPKATETSKITAPKATAAEMTADAEAHRSKGIKGLFHKLRHRKSHVEEDDNLVIAASIGAVTGSAACADEQHEEAAVQSTPIVATTVTKPPSLPQHIGTDGQIGDSQYVSGVAGESTPISPSSFKRRDADESDADISSLSSSGVGEEDFKEGCTGRAARALGLKRKNEPEIIGAMSTQAEPKTDVGDDLDDEDEETFEEARDTVATPQVERDAIDLIAPNDATQHVRETKFQEVL